MKVKFLKGRKYEGKHYGFGDIAEVDAETAQQYFYSKAAIEHNEPVKKDVQSSKPKNRK